MTDDEWEPWCRIELWSLREAAYLLQGQSPRAERQFFEEHVQGSPDTPVAHAYNALKAATFKGTLRFVQADVVDTLMHRRVAPVETVAWALGLRMEVPARLVALAEAAASPARAQVGDRPRTVTRWTRELVAEAWECRQRLERERVKAPMRETAKRYGVSSQLLRAQFTKHGMRDSSPAQLSSSWPDTRRKVYRSR